jgi:hypothetical protein
MSEQTVELLNHRNGRPHKNGPFKVRIGQRVSGDGPWTFLFCEAGEHDAYCNSYGAVFVDLGGEQSLGLKPGEFEYVTLPPNGCPLALTPEQARAMADELWARRSETR